MAGYTVYTLKTGAEKRSNLDDEISSACSDQTQNHKSQPGKFMNSAQQEEKTSTRNLTPEKFCSVTSTLTAYLTPNAST